MSLRSLAIAATLVAGLMMPAIAHAAYTTGSVNVRSGPGTRYYIITTAPPGAWVGVRNCLPRWCRITYRGVTGWMSSAYIAYARPAPRYYAPPRYVYRPPPPVYYYPPPYVRRYPPPPPPRYRRPHGYYGFYFGFGR